MKNALSNETQEIEEMEMFSQDVARACERRRNDTLNRKENFITSTGTLVGGYTHGVSKRRFITRELGSFERVRSKTYAFYRRTRRILEQNFTVLQEKYIVE